MNHSRRAVVVLGCLLAACARMPGAPGGSASGTCAPAPAVRSASAPRAARAAPGSGTTAAPAAAPAASSALHMTPIGDMLRHVGAQTQAEAHSDEQRLRKLAAARNAQQRVHLAYLLLARAKPSVEQANQALDLLDGLDHPGVDPGARQFVRVLQRLARQTLGLAQLRTELGRASRQVADLQDKIAQIKNLEVQLQDRRNQQGQGSSP